MDFYILNIKVGQADYYVDKILSLVEYINRIPEYIVKKEPSGSNVSVCTGNGSVV